MGKVLGPNEVKYQGLADSNPDPVFIISGSSGQIVHANSAAITISGFTPGDLLSHSFKEFIHPQEIGKLMRGYQSRLEGKAFPQKYETRVIAKDGRILHVWIQGQVIFWLSEPADYIVMQAISSLKKLEEMIDRHASVLDALGEHVMVIDVNGIVRYISQSWIKSHGLRQDAFVGRNSLEFFVPGFTEKTPEIWKKLLAGMTWQGKAPILYPGSRRMSGWMHISPVLDENREVIGCLSVTVDIEEQKSAEKKSAEQNRMLDSLVKGIATDADGAIIHFSEAAGRTFGWSEEETLGHLIFDYFDPQFRDTARKELTAIQFDKKARSLECPVICKDGGIKRFWLSLYTVPDDAGQLAGVMWAISPEQQLRSAGMIETKPVREAATGAGADTKQYAIDQLKQIRSHYEAAREQLLKISDLLSERETSGLRPASDLSSPHQESGKESKVAVIEQKPRLEIYCLGPLSVCSSKKRVQYWQNRRVKSVLEFLISRRGTPVAKEMLMETLWPDFSPQAASNNLKSTIHDLRLTLDQLFEVEFPYVLLSQSGYLINPDIEMIIDVEIFEQHWAMARRKEKEGNTAEAIREYEQAEYVYQGDYLEDDPYEDWIMPRRETLRDTYLLILNRLANFSLENADYESCIAYCYKGLAKDSCREDVYRKLMCCYSRLGQRNDALRWFENCRRTIKAELNVAPDPQTSELYERLLKGEVL